MSKQTNFKFTAKDFYALLEKQFGKCALTNRELTPISCEVELIEPDKEEGKFDNDNFYMVCRELKFLCRNLSGTEIIHLCAEIIKHRGKEYGYTLHHRKGGK